MRATENRAELRRPVPAPRIADVRRRPRIGIGVATSRPGDGPASAQADRNDDVAAIARGGFANLLGAVTSVLTNFLLTIVVTRFVSPVQAGAFFAVTSLFLIGQTVGRLGGDTGMVYFVARWRALGLQDRIRAGLRTSLTWTLAGCASVSLLAIVFAPQLAHVFGGRHDSSVWLIRVLALLLPLATMNDVALGATRGFGWMTPTVLIERIGRPLIQLALVVAVLAAGFDGALGIAWALPYLVAFVAIMYATRYALRTYLLPGPVAGVDLRALAREYWSFSLPRAFAGVAQIVLQRLDIVLVALLSGPRDAAIYTAATRFLVVGQFMNQAISAPIQPRLSAALSAGDTARAGSLYRMSTAWLVLTNWPLFGAALGLAPLYVSVFGHGYDSGATVVVLLAAAMLVATGVGLVDSVIIMAGRTSWNLGTTLLALAANVGVDLALIPHYGIVGAAIGWCASILAANVVPLALSWSRLGLHPFGKPTLVAYALCGGLFVALPAVARAIGGTVWALAALGAAIVLFVLAVHRLRDLFDLTSLFQTRRISRRPAEQP